jgi:hypothetical protein
MHRFCMSFLHGLSKEDNETHYQWCVALETILKQNNKDERQ